jgi:hypothetical protein
MFFTSSLSPPTPRSQVLARLRGVAPSPSVARVLACDVPGRFESLLASLGAIATDVAKTLTIETLHLRHVSPFSLLEIALARWEWRA